MGAGRGDHCPSFQSLFTIKNHIIMKNYTLEETLKFKANRNNKSRFDKLIRKGHYRIRGDGRYEHSITRKVFNFFSANRTMVIAPLSFQPKNQ